MRGQATMQQAKALLMPDSAFQTIFGVQPTRTENSINAYKQASPQAPLQAILYKMGFTGPNAMKDAREQIDKERTEQEKIKSKMADVYDKALSRQETHEYHQGIEGRYQDKNRRQDAANSEGEKLTQDGLKLAEEFIRAGKPLPGGWSAKGIGRGNSILNDMAKNQEGGAGSGSVTGNQAQYKADSAGLTQLTKDITG
jgi:hypothetical protein